MIKPERITAVFLGVLAVLAVLTILHLTASVVLPLITAVLVSFVVSPGVSFLHRKIKIPRPVAITLIMLFVMSVMFLIGLFFYSSVQSLYRELPKYSGKFTVIVSSLLEKFDLPRDLLEEFSWVRTLSSSLLAVSRQFVDFLRGLILMVLFLVFLLFERAHIRPKVREAFQTRTTLKIFSIYAHIARQIGKYLSVKMLVSAATGSAVWLILVIAGVEFAFLWGVLTFFFNFMPNIGSIIITIFVEAFAVLQFYPSLVEPAGVLIAMFVVQQLLGNIAEPTLLGGRLNLSPVVIILSLVIWGWIWGVMGMFLAVPLIVAIKIVLENIPVLKPAAILMGTGTTLKITAKKI
ncbi:MAG: AI-2E family transporter [Spirochaetales bacterium]|jgi:predicted PurR-regulated permease PerM|nr:AI-2E family transporter [Spirochaetales bacterium]